MATGSFVGVTPGTGLKLATGPTYSEGGNTVQDEKVILGHAYEAHYSVNTGNSYVLSTPRALLALNAGASLIVSVTRIRIYQAVLAGTATTANFSVYRLTSAPTGGVVLTPRAYDPADPAPGATAMAPSMTATLGVSLLNTQVGCFAAHPIPSDGASYEWRMTPGAKPIVIAAGTANGIAVYCEVGIATAAWNAEIEFTETPY